MGGTLVVIIQRLQDREAGFYHKALGPLRKAVDARAGAQEAEGFHLWSVQGPQASSATSSCR